MIYNASQTEVLHNSIKLEDIPIFKPLHSIFIWRPDTHSFTNELKCGRIRMVRKCPRKTSTYTPISGNKKAVSTNMRPLLFIVLCVCLKHKEYSKVWTNCREAFCLINNVLVKGNTVFNVKIDPQLIRYHVVCSNCWR